MNKFFDLIDKYKFGIIAVFMVYTGIFMYLQMSTYPEYIEINAFNDGARLEMPEDKEIQLTPENIEVATDFTAGKVTNTSRDMNDKRERSEEDWSSSKSASETEQSVKDEERKMFEEAGGAAKRKAIQEQDAERKKNKKDHSVTKDKETKPGGENAPKGNVMVEYNLGGRSSHQNNDWNVRNPGYTCGTGSSGRVVISIKVGQDGRVISAIYDQAASTSANSCMVEQALKYAKLSRFEYSSTEVSQSGKIYYTFVSQ